MNEKRERFVRVAESRTNKIIEMIRLLGNCSNKSNYEFDEKDISKIYDTIKNELNDSQAKFKISCKKNALARSLKQALYLTKCDKSDILIILKKFLTLVEYLLKTLYLGGNNYGRK